MCRGGLLFLIAAVLVGWLGNSISWKKGVVVWGRNKAE
jgi:hypothetical protein